MSDRRHLNVTAEHDGLVFRAAKKYYWGMRQCGIGWDDLVQAGRMGVMRAQKRYDPARGTKFSTYAEYWICHYIRREAANHGRTVRVPVSTAHSAWKKGQPIRSVRVAADQWTPKNGEPLGDVSFFDMIGHISESSAEQEADMTVLRAHVERAMKRCLTPRERDILRSRIWHEDTLEASGARHGITRERTRQIEKAALEKLRGALVSVEHIG
jgi:RNA polymerase primary sigma factor